MARNRLQRINITVTMRFHFYYGSISEKIQNYDKKCRMIPEDICRMEAADIPVIVSEKRLKREASVLFKRDAPGVPFGAEDFFLFEIIQD